MMMVRSRVSRVNEVDWTRSVCGNAVRWPWRTTAVGGGRGVVAVAVGRHGGDGGGGDSGRHGVEVGWRWCVGGLEVSGSRNVG